MSRTREDIEAMLARVADGDRAAFLRLYDATSAKLFGVCLRILKDRGEAEEVLQEIFFKVWQNADRYRANGFSPMTWLITVARNAAIDRLRARRARTGEDDDEMARVPDSRPGPEAAAVARSEARRISECLDELEGRRADAVRGVYLDGLSYQDLARRHDVPLNTMKTWLRRSLMSLKDCLSR